jgi:hypothetical protein
VLWNEPDWLDDTAVWISRNMGRRGSLRARHVRQACEVVRRKPWSIVVRVRGRRRTLWFKELGPALEHEPRLTEQLGHLAPTHVPELVAAEGRRILMLDAGRKLSRPDDVRTFARQWATTIAGYAKLQIGLSAVDDLPAPDCRPHTLAARFGADVAPLAARLGEGIPYSLVHLDVTHKNICVRDGQPVLIDWGEAAIGHPFCGLVKPLRTLVGIGARPGSPEIVRLRDAYLEPWSHYASPAELRAIFDAAYRLGPLCHAVLAERKLASFPTEPDEPYLRKLHKRLAKKTSTWLGTFANYASVPELLGL